MVRLTVHTSTHTMPMLAETGMRPKLQEECSDYHCTPVSALIIFI